MFKFDNVLNETFNEEYNKVVNGNTTYNYFIGNIMYRKDDESDIWSYPIHGFFIDDKRVSIYDGLKVENDENEIVVPINTSADMKKTKAMIAFAYNYMHGLEF